MMDIIRRREVPKKAKPRAAKMAGLMIKEMCGFLRHPELVKHMEEDIGMLIVKMERAILTFTPVEICGQEKDCRQYCIY